MRFLINPPFRPLLASQPLHCHPPLFFLSPPREAGPQGKARLHCGLHGISGGKILSVALGPRFHGGDRKGAGMVKGILLKRLTILLKITQN